MLFRKFAAVIAAIAVASGTLMAQTSGSTPPRMRLTLAGKYISGRLTAVDVDALTLLPDGKGDPIRIQLSSISSAEISAGKRSRAGANLAGVGVGVGVWFGALIYGVHSCGGIFSCSNSAASTWLVVGIASGIAVAHRIRRERWRPVPLTSLTGLAAP
jgi:hypothetical protein